MSNRNKKRVVTKEFVRKEFGTTKKKLSKLGFEKFQSGKYETLKDVIESSDGMIVAQCKSTCTMDANGKPIVLKSGDAYVMPQGQFAQMNKKELIFKPYRKPFKDFFKRYKGEDLNGKRLLIWRTGGLGDVIVTQSVVAALKNKFPSCYISYATSPVFADIFYSWPTGLVDRVLTIPFSVDEMKQHDYHMTFIHTVENCIETTTMNFFDIFQKLTQIDYDPVNHMSKLIPIPSIVDKLRSTIPPNTILIHMSASTNLRKYPPHGWSMVIKNLLSKGYFVGIIDAPGKRDEIFKFIKYVIDSHSVVGLDSKRIGNFAVISQDVNYATAITSLCKASICVDSAFGHITAALGMPGVTLHGPHPSYNVSGRYSTIVKLDPPEGWNECDKYPCFYNSQEPLCPFVKGGMFPGCMSTISPDKIVESLLEAIEKHENSN